MNLLILIVLLCALLCVSSDDQSIQVVEENAVDELQKRLTALSNEKEALLLENNEIKKRQTQLERNIEQLTKKSSYILELGKLEDRYAQLVTETSARTNLLTETITRLEGDIISEKERSKKALAEQMESLGGGTAVHELQEKVRKLEEQAQTHQQNAEKYATLAAELDVKLSELRTALARITHERDQLLLDVRSAGGAVSKAQKEAHLTKDRYNAAQRRLEEQAVTIKELELHHDKCRALATEHETAVTALRAELDRSPFRALFQGLRRLKSFVLRVLFWKGKSKAQ
jgi:chromosome segregation ATPase